MGQGIVYFLFGAVVLFLIILAKIIKIVPQQSVYIVERLGKYSMSLNSGFHMIVPFIDKVSYIHTLKEQAIDVPSQQCITKDNITVEVDGVMYLQVLDPVKASYGINNYIFAIIQLAQTTMRSEMGKIELDKSFEEREVINSAIVRAVDSASDAWGVKITRYEIKNITPPQSIKDAMEKQMRAEREKRALIAQSEGEKQAKINIAEGEREQAIKISEGEKQRRINEAEGKAAEILNVANATAEGIHKVAEEIQKSGGSEAVSLIIAEQYIQEFGRLAKTNNTMIIPNNLSDVAGIVASLSKVMKDIKEVSVDKN